MKRLGIFVFYDKEGIVDDYVVYLLKSIQPYLDKLVIVCNGKLTEEGKSRLSAFSDSITVRENTGYDAMAYKLAMTEYLGWEEVQKYEEALLFNDTFFGPFYPFSEVFQKMENTPCDFWGLTYHEKAKDYYNGTDEILPPCLQTYFCAYRKSVLKSDAFMDYWNRFDSTEWIFSDVARHEQFFTKYLEDAGFTWDAYVDAKEYNSREPEGNFIQYYYVAHELIRDYRCPVIKRKNFVIKRMNMQSGNTGEDIANALRYIDKNTDYDINLIWSNILRLYNITEIKNALHLDYVLPWNQAQALPAVHAHEKTAVIAYLSYKNRLGRCLPYLQRIPETIDLYIATPDREIERQIRDICQQPAWKNCHVLPVPDKGQKNCHVLPVPDKGREIGALFIECKDLLKKYEYVCFVHDEKIESEKAPVTIGKSHMYNMWENTLKSADYIENVLSLFEQNSRLGFLAPPQPIHAGYFGSIGQEWGNNYENTVKLAQKLGIQTAFSVDIPCFALGNTFWCRTKALQPLLAHGFTYEELSKEPTQTDGALCHAIERVYPYAAQSQGYYSGIVMNTDYASLQNTNLYHYLSGVLSALRARQTITDYDSVFQTDVLSYCKGKENILIYGAGTDGVKTSNILKNNQIYIKGFIVSDDQPRQEEKNGFPIYRLSEIPYEKQNIGIIVAVGYSRDRREVLNNLAKKGYEDFYQL